MNCDDFLPAMEIGDPEQQQEARRHAASCPSCATAHAKLLQIKATLADHEPLSALARAVWEDASRGRVTERARRTGWTPVLAGILTAAASVFLVFILVISRRDVDPRAPIVGPPAGPITIIKHDPTAELAELAAAVETLDGDLVALAEHAERLDIEREIALTLNQYKRW